MSLSDVFRLLVRQWLLLLMVPIVISAAAYYFIKDSPKSYNSTTTIYTGIASGYSLSGNAEADYSKTNIAYDNLTNLITARSTKEEVIYQLLGNHLWASSQQPELLSTKQYKGLEASLPSAIRQQLVGNTLSATLENVRRYAQANTTNSIYQMLNSENATYSLRALSNLTASRIGSSDLIRLEFESYDPEICRSTLDLTTQVYLEKSKNLREGQTAKVIDYYEAELRRAKERLAMAEAKNLAFNRTNNIINYDEQSKNVATEKETLASALTEVSKQYAGAQASLNAINRKLGGNQAALLSSRQVLEQRQKLSRLNASLADQQLFSQQQELGNAPKTKQLQAEADKVAQAIQDNVDSYYARSTSTEGVPNKELLTEWVQDMILVESNRAKLAVMRRREQEFDREYQRMAPLGATLKRIEREIELAEKDYLSLLASLNASKASQQNTQLTANLKIIDPPNLPSIPKASKLRLLVPLSGLGGFVFIASIILGLGLLDKSLKNPTVAEQRIGLPVAGIMLDERAKPTKQLAASKQRSIDQLVRYILQQANASAASSPFVVGIFSVQHYEGKTLLCQSLSQRCQELGVQTLALFPEGNETHLSGDAPFLFYPSEIAAMHGWQLDQLIENAILRKEMTGMSPPDVKVVLVEFPALREEALPVGALRQLNLVFLTVPATRAWRLTDHQAVERLRAATSASVEVVLSGVALHHSEEALS